VLYLFEHGHISFGNVPFGIRLPSWFFAQLAMTMLPGFSEGSMGADIHPYPEGEESALMVRPLSSAMNSSDFWQKSSLHYIPKMETALNSNTSNTIGLGVDINPTGWIDIVT
jgi:hypothetical protein